MAFILGQWGQINVSTNTGAPNIFNYINLSDTSTQMLSAGYFNQQAGILNVGDSILSVASDLTKLLRVTAVSHTNAQTYSVTVLSDFANDISGGLEILTEGTLEASDVLTLATVPFLLVDSPGDGVTAVPVDLALTYNFGTTPYTISGTPSVECGWLDVVTPSENSALLPIDAIGFLDQTVDTLALTQGYATTPLPLAAIENIPVYLALSDGVDLTDGDGTITYRLVYRLFF